ncbi:MAG: hypothetical protein JW999_04630 [Methanotrichaceae archaeon]|nr:hypothetical protein [Methanotrichaceae archaeon]
MTKIDEDDGKAMFSERKWSKPERKIARRAFDAAYNRECDFILQNEGWLRKEDLESISEDKLQEIWKVAEFYAGL